MSEQEEAPIVTRSEAGRLFDLQQDINHKVSLLLEKHSLILKEIRDLLIENDSRLKRLELKDQGYRVKRPLIPRDGD